MAKRLVTKWRFPQLNIQSCQISHEISVSVKCYTHMNYSAIQVQCYQRCQLLENPKSKGGGPGAEQLDLMLFSDFLRFVK